VISTSNIWKPFVALVLILALYAPTASARGSQSTYRTTVLTQINDLRASNGLPALKLDRKLAASAQRYSALMASAGALSHDLGSPLGTRVGRRGTAVGETIALGMGPAETVLAWLGSSGHAAQMLSARYRVAGVGAAPGTYNGRTAVFVTVQYVG